jgi:pyruvate/2-oxoglutarate/acetoin dehydrogenase E1 component
MAKLNLVKALNLALLQEMERDEDVLIMGEDVGSTAACSASPRICTASSAPSA